MLRRHSTMDPFNPRPSLRGGHRMTLYSWGDPRHFPAAAAADDPLFRRRARLARRSRTATGSRGPGSTPTLVALHGLNGSSDAHYMKGHRRQSVRARHERRPPQPAELRRHRAPVGRAVSLRPDRRPEVRDGGADRGRRPAVDRRGRLFAGRQPRAEAGRRVRRRRRRRRFARSRRSRRSSRSASASARSSAGRTFSTSGTSCAT